MKLAVLGAGFRFPLAAQFTAHGADIVAVVEPRAHRHERAESIIGPGFLRLAHHGELVGLRDRGELDAAVVLTPDHTHAEIAIDLLHAHIPVYLEKPLAITIDDCDRILRAAYDTGTRLYVGHNMRHMRFVQMMKEIIDQGLIGEIQAIWCRHFVGYGGDYYFKDWHAERAKSAGLLLQKAAHDIDVIHMLAGSHTTLASGMGHLAVYGRVDDRRDNDDRLMGPLASVENWPPLAQTELNPVIDVEDLSHMQMRLANDVLATYNQCHFTPDYWRNYTVIGTEGRIENFGDGPGGSIKLWNRRGTYRPEPDEEWEIPSAEGSHGGADFSITREFLDFVAGGTPTLTSPTAARDAVAAALAATTSIRSGSMPAAVAELDPAVRAYFEAGQPRI